MKWNIFRAINDIFFCILTPSWRLIHKKWFQFKFCVHVFLYCCLINIILIACTLNIYAISILYIIVTNYQIQKTWFMLFPHFTFIKYFWLIYKTMNSNNIGRALKIYRSFFAATSDCPSRPLKLYIRRWIR
jgi:hypothetical protein